MNKGMNNLNMGSWSFSIDLFMWLKAMIGNKTELTATIPVIWWEKENTTTFKIYTALENSK